MSSAAQYASTVTSAAVQVTTANTARDGTGTLGTTLITVLTAGASGTRIDDIYMVGTGTTTAGVIRLFVFDGTNTRLLSETLVTAITPSTTLPVWNNVLLNQGIVLKTGYALRATTNNTETFNIIVTRAGDF
jgi:hypothetical protein